MKNLLEEDIVGIIGTQKYRAEIKWRNGILIMDEPTTIEGQDLGPDPYTTLLASLAGCTLSTLRMYISRKGWDIPEIRIAVNMFKEEDQLTTIIKREITFPELTNEEWKQRLLEIAKKCPVSRILENNIVIKTSEV